jgi:hypothetical protein
LYSFASGYVETPEWLKDRRAIINIKNKDDKCFIKCICRAINYDKTNRNNSRDVTDYELQEFRKKFKCDSVDTEILDISKFEEDNPEIGIDIYYIPMNEDGEVNLIYRSKNQNLKYQVALGLLENEDNAHYVIIRKLSQLLKLKNQLKNGYGICHWCKGQFRYNNKSFDKHLLSCKERVVVRPSDKWDLIKLPKQRI